MIHLRPGLGSWRYSGDFCPPNVVLDLSSEWTEVLATDRLLHLWALEGCQPNHNGYSGRLRAGMLMIKKQNLDDGQNGKSSCIGVPRGTRIGKLIPADGFIEEKIGESMVQFSKDLLPRQPSCLGRTAETLRLGHGHVIRIAAEGVLDDGQKLKEMASESPVHATVMGGMWWLKLC
ncbi:unnamed protein product [Bursaphelenchus xylophilus]|uniref:(pine wood nematode) hypothetical protein n=1 Tax=Bursaphelenchus xylophilus TaxID=6326 RepID=A0A7I8XNF7_BURXY|nr:unnamed protein product [Bursaphelenchus xylophilus]CAG9088959.1 unnamed protein product [Bursaphelenchus xylophilus]